MMTFACKALSLLNLFTFTLLMTSLLGKYFCFAQINRPWSNDTGQ